MSVKLKSITLFFSVIAMACSTAAQDYNQKGIECKWIPARATTLDDLIQQSQYIGLYKSFGSYESPMSDRLNKDVPIYMTRLENSVHLFGKFHEVIEVQSTDQILQIPSEYFYIKDIHSELVMHDKLGLGLAYETMDKNGNCVYGASFITGYEYLVFGGANSPAIYQPILNRKYDPLYIEVVKRIRAKKKAAQPLKK